MDRGVGTCLHDMANCYIFRPIGFGKGQGTGYIMWHIVTPSNLLEWVWTGEWVHDMAGCYFFSLIGFVIGQGSGYMTWQIVTLSG